jgi:hypothetical protein
VKVGAMDVLHGDKLNTIVGGVGKKGCCMKVPNLQEAKTALVRVPLLGTTDYNCAIPLTRQGCASGSWGLEQQEKKWLNELNTALGEKLEAHLNNPKGPSLPISIHFAPSKSAGGSQTAEASYSA